MTKILEISSEGLFTEALLYACPSKIESLAEMQRQFAAWTENADGAIYSGYRRETLAQSGLEFSVALAKQLRTRFDHLIVLGIGGSALGTRTGLSALRWAVPETDRRNVFVIDNLDPVEFETTLSGLDLSRTAFAIVTKSGGTIETMAQASVVFERLGALKLEVSEHVVAITDPKDGALRKWVEANSIRSLPIPSTVGGRFSVLTPVGIFPMAFAGIDVEALVRGASMVFGGQVLDREFVARMGLRLAELELSGFLGHVCMPYGTLLKDFSLWFVQLWGESLGKKRKNQGAVGAIPISAVGATDQHSLLQLLVEGPARIVTGFIGINEWPPMGSRKVAMGKLPPEFASLTFASGKSFGEILTAERLATQTVLQSSGRPIYEVKVPQITAESLGALFAFYMDLVVFTAAALNVNPFDQPGVEAGKKILPSLLQAG